MSTLLRRSIVVGQLLIVRNSLCWSSMGLVWTFLGCSGRVESVDSGAPSGVGASHWVDSPGGGSASGGSASGGSASGSAAGPGGGQASGGQSTGSGGVSSGGTSADEAGGASPAGGAGGTDACGGCSPEHEQCVLGTCQANDAVREATVMVHVPGDTFVMGTEDWEQSSPVHERTLLDFYMDQTEVTAFAYDLCVGAGSCTVPPETGVGANFRVPGYENHPINYVTLRQAEAYCAWMGKRLPTEAEWEYAAGGRQGLDYSWGNGPPGGCISGATNPTPQLADFEHGCAVGQFPPNENGLLDMGGNMYEFTSSPWCPYSSETQSGYAEDCDTEYFAKRDGGFTAISNSFARVAFREPVPEDGIYQSLGFRCAKDAL